MPSTLGCSDKNSVTENGEDLHFLLFFFFFFWIDKFKNDNGH